MNFRSRPAHFLASRADVLPFGGSPRARSAERKRTIRVFVQTVTFSGLFT
jgi:hypothetical protein